MLATVKSFIDSISDMTFNEYYVHYILRVQDRDLENEINSLRRRNTLNIYVMDKLITTSCKGLVNR